MIRQMSRVYFASSVLTNTCWETGVGVGRGRIKIKVQEGKIIFLLLII